MIEVDRALGRQSVCRCQNHFTRNVANGSCNRGNCSLAEVVHRRVARKDHNRTSLIRTSELVPADLTASHYSPQPRSDSETSNSPLATFCLEYPARCLASSCRR